MTDKAPSVANKYPSYSPRFWHGYSLGRFLRLLAENHFRIDAIRWSRVASIIPYTLLNSLLNRIAQWIYRSRIDRTEIEHAPIFILGHWRSGTTYLHELLSLDPRFQTPNTYQCFAPEHFLLTEKLLSRALRALLPKVRPMDNMAIGWDRPQEDEFALMVMGLPSPYKRMAFPNEPWPDMDYLNMEGVTDEAKARWGHTLKFFCRALTLADPRRLVLKSPTHTGRLGYLAELFPDAKFIHVVRDPATMFPSTRHLWRSLDHIQGLQLPDETNLDEYIHQCHERMYENFARQMAGMPKDRFCEIRYEDLCLEPKAVLARIYQTLSLGGFKSIAPLVDDLLEKSRDYQINVYVMEPEKLRILNNRWHGYMQRYGYLPQPSAQDTTTATG